jgi:CRP/FNR family transcriptional regulator, cyclic AMP receptor protein
MDTVRALKQVIMFKDVPEPVLEIVAGTAEEVSFPAGETIISMRDTPNALFVIRNGTVRVHLEDGVPPVFFGTGETLGDGTFIDGGQAGGTAVAVERVDLLVFRSAKVADALAGHPEAGYELYRAIARSLAGHLRRAAGMISFSRERETQS